MIIKGILKTENGDSGLHVLCTHQGATTNCADANCTGCPTCMCYYEQEVSDNWQAMQANISTTLCPICNN